MDDLESKCRCIIFWINLIFELEYMDGSKKEVRIPAEIWKMSESTVTKVFASEKEIKTITLDPLLETADVDLANNNWPPRIVPTRFELFKQNQQSRGENPMQKAKKESEKK